MLPCLLAFLQEIHPLSHGGSITGYLMTHSPFLHYQTASLCLFIMCCVGENKQNAALFCFKMGKKTQMFLSFSREKPRDALVVSEANAHEYKEDSLFHVILHLCLPSFPVVSQLSAARSLIKDGKHPRTPQK